MDFHSKTDFLTLTYSRQLCMLANQYDDAINFTLGDPDLSTPKPICDAAYKSMLEGKTHYAPNAGIPVLRQAICDFVNKTKHANYVQEQCIVTIGAVSAIYLSFMALINPGDEVIIIAPYWSQYKNIITLLGGKPVIIDRLDSRLNPDIDYLKQSINNSTKAIVVNNPNNPSGHVYPKEILESIAKIANENNLFVFADEVYDALVYEKPFESMTSFCPKDKLLLFNSCSKSFAMTGWRVGYLLGPSDFVKSVIKLQQNMVASVPSMTQYAALEAFTNAGEYMSTVVNTFYKRRNVLMNGLSEIPQMRYADMEGTFYAFIDISKTGKKSRDFCFDLLDKQHVAVVPGIAYGDKFDSYIRLAYTQTENKLIEGIKRIATYVQRIC